VKPQVSRTFELDQIQDAMKTVEGAGVRGKVVVRIVSENDTLYHFFDTVAG